MADSRKKALEEMEEALNNLKKTIMENDKSALSKEQADSFGAPPPPPPVNQTNQSRPQGVKFTDIDLVLKEIEDAKKAIATKPPVNVENEIDKILEDFNKKHQPAAKVDDQTNKAQIRQSAERQPTHAQPVAPATISPREENKKKAQVEVAQARQYKEAIDRKENITGNYQKLKNLIGKHVDLSNREIDAYIAKKAQEAGEKPVARASNTAQAAPMQQAVKKPSPLDKVKCFLHISDNPSNNSKKISGLRVLQAKLPDNISPKAAYDQAKKLGVQAVNTGKGLLVHIEKGPRTLKNFVSSMATKGINLTNDVKTRVENTFSKKNN